MKSRPKRNSTATRKSPSVPEEADFSEATRKLLFRGAASAPAEKSIPGAGRSAAETPRRHVRSKITMNVDGDILAQFKELSLKEGLPYQTLMNRALREYLQGNRSEQVAADVSELLLQSESFLEAIQEKVKSRGS